MFESAKLKIKRADHHILDLERQITAFVQSDFYRLSIERDAETGNDSAKFIQIKSIPDEWALIIGDAVHNLRTALDYLMTDLSGDERADFIFHQTRDNLVNALNNGPIKNLSSSLKEIIINDIEPYEGGNGDSLWILNQMDRRDKHRLLIPVVFVGMVTGVCIENKNQDIKMINHTLTFGPDLKAAVLISTGAGLEVTNNGHASIRIVFGTGQFLKGQPVVPALKQLSELVLNVIYSFERSHVDHERPTSSL